jgi:hypothetical protein
VFDDPLESDKPPWSTDPARMQSYSDVCRLTLQSFFPDDAVKSACKPVKSDLLKGIYAMLRKSIVRSHLPLPELEIVLYRQCDLGMFPEPLTQSKV